MKSTVMDNGVLTQNIEIQLSKIILKISKKYYFLGWDNSQFESIANQEIKENAWQYQEISSYVNQFKHNLKDKINCIIKQKIELDNSNQTLFSYVNCCLEKNKEKQDLQKLQALHDMFLLIDYFPESEFYDVLIQNNDQLVKILNFIIEDNLKVIKKSGVDFVAKDPVSVILLEKYCKLQGILIGENNSMFEEFSFFADDNFSREILTNESAYITEISQIPLLSPEQIKNLMLKIQEEKKNQLDGKLTPSQKIIMEHNLRLVIFVAKNYIGMGLDFMELIQEGNLGLIKAIEKYDVSKGFHFSTYATWWIRNFIRRAVINKGKMIRFPENKYNQYLKYKSIRSTLEIQLGRTPTLREIALELNYPLEKVIMIQQLHMEVFSLNFKLWDQEDEELENYISSDIEVLDDFILQSALATNMMSVVDNCDLSEKERKVLELFFGLKGNSQHTLEEIGEMYQVKRQRIHQVKKNALNKLRRYSETIKLVDYMDNPDQALINLETENNKHSHTKHSKKRTKSKKIID